MRTLGVRIRGFLDEEDGRIFKNARSVFSSVFSFRSRSSSALSNSVTSACLVALRLLNAVTHRLSVTSLMPSSRATVAAARPVLMTGFTASSLCLGVNSRRVLAIVNILSCEVSTRRGQSQASLSVEQQTLYEAWLDVALEATKLQLNVLRQYFHSAKGQGTIEEMRLDAVARTLQGQKPYDLMRETVRRVMPAVRALVSEQARRQRRDLRLTKSVPPRQKPLNARKLWTISQRM